MLTTHELQDRKQKFRNKSKRFIRSHDKAEQRCLQSTGSIEPGKWNEEVVRALSTRMPGGLSTITHPCKFCESVFYPCLCIGGAHRHRRVLLAPRVTREAEARRLLNEPMGNLRELMTSVDILGMDKDKLHISGPAEADRPCELPVEAFSDCQIQWREDATYVVNPQAPPVKQDLVLTKDELQKLQCVLVERDNSFTVRERWEGREVKPHEVVYRNAQEAVKDIKLQQVQTDRESYWEVCKVKDDGVASKARMVPGQRLSEISIALPDPLQLKLVRSDVNLDDIKGLRWESIKVEDMPDIPKCFSDWGSSADDAGLSFPCKLKFDLVAPGSQVIAARAGREKPKEEQEEDEGHKISLDLLEKLQKESECTIQFERAPRERITRSSAAVRHRHFKESDSEGWKDDLSLFETWLASKAMSPNHLKFVFKKLLESVRKELTEFERKKTHRFQSLLAKSIRFVDLTARRDQLTEIAATASLQQKRHHKELLAEINVIEQELELLFDQVPLFFLSDISELAGDIITSGNKMEQIVVPMPEPNAAPSRRSRSLPAATMMHVSSMKEAEESLEELMGQAMPCEERKRLQEAFKYLHKKSEEYHNKLHGRGKKLDTQSANGHGHEDGRLSFKEFEKVMLLSGVNWLASEELRVLFDSMDADGSGKLNLGELQNTAIRLSDLAGRVQTFREENKGMSAENCLLEFGQLLQMGHDLVGPQAHPLLPDSHISASSYFNERAEYGKQQMWRSRLDCIDSCWVGKPKDQDPNPWLQWQFSSCREIRAIGTKGRPDTDSWVTKFTIKYLAEELEDDEEIPADGHFKWKMYCVKGWPMQLDGNFDRNTRKDNLLEPFVASCVRIYPVEHRGLCPAMRASIYGTFRPPQRKSAEQAFELFCQDFTDVTRPIAKSIPRTKILEVQQGAKSGPDTQAG
ncbi:unnamed protein product [Durusdinium trenchii]